MLLVECATQRSSWALHRDDDTRMTDSPLSIKKSRPFLSHAFPLFLSSGGKSFTKFLVSGEYVTQRSNLALHRGDATRVTDSSLSETLYSKLQSLSLSLCSEDVRGVKGA